MKETPIRHSCKKKVEVPLIKEFITNLNQSSNTPLQSQIMFDKIKTRLQKSSLPLTTSELQNSLLTIDFSQSRALHHSSSLRLTCRCELDAESPTWTIGKINLFIKDFWREFWLETTIGKVVPGQTVSKDTFGIHAFYLQGYLWLAPSHPSHLHWILSPSQVLWSSLAWLPSIEVCSQNSVRYLLHPFSLNWSCKRNVGVETPIYTWLHLLKDDT